MLLEFSVENFRSIKERVTLSMVAASRDKSHSGNTTQVDGEGFRALRSVAIYGPNASGKSPLSERSSSRWT